MQVLTRWEIGFSRVQLAMGHRHMFNPPQIFETDSDQGWNHAEQPYMPMARVGASESSSLIPPLDHMASQGGRFTSQWIPAPRSSGYSPSVLNGELPHYQPQAPGPSRDHFLHQSGAGNFHIPQDNFSYQPSSSHLSGPTLPAVDGGFFDQTMVSGRGTHKRKSPGNPSVCDRGSTSRYYDVGSSSNLHLPADPWEEKQNTESYNASWDYPSAYRGNSLSIGSEGTLSLRNVRSRAAVDLETNPSRAHLSSNSMHNSFSSQTTDQSNLVDVWGQTSHAPTREWNRSLILPAGHGVTFGSDSSFFGHDPNPLNPLNNHPNGAMEIGGYNNEITSNRNPVPQNVSSNLNQSVRGVRSGYGQRSVPSFRASSSNFRPGHVAASNEGLQIVAESYPSRHPRAFSSIRMRNMDRNGRTLISSDRHRSINEEASFRDRLTPEGLMVVDHHSAFYGSRALIDQHRDMRLDTDNMSYEELLALGERIGNVNTGLSDDLIAKCLTESIYCSSDLLQDEGICVICLEEYKNMDDVGTMKVCGHDFHVGCIRKWLSLKNLCPICKATAMTI